jgi:hypothetical protein
VEDASGNPSWSAAGSGTVTEQKNTFGYGLTSSGNCDNTSTNASSPCNAAVSLSVLNNSLGSNVSLNNTSNYFDGPSVAQGTTGTWWASGNVNVTDSAGVASIYCKLWDGTTVIDSAGLNTVATNYPAIVSLSGYIASPAGNIRISCRDSSSTSGVIQFNTTGNSKDATISAHRIQ